MKKLSWEKLAIIFIAVITLGLLGYFISDLVVDIIKLNKQGILGSINTNVSDKNVFKWLAVIFIEAMQMIVVFISAEIIQIAASISFVWYIAIALCITGIALGATIIYILVNKFNFDHSVFNKKTKKIEYIQKRRKKDSSIQTLMYILLLTPIVPFGAVCYFGATNKISFKRYILTIVTGTIPSILISMVFGNAIIEFIIRDIKWWLLLIILLGLLIIVFSLVAVILNKLFFKPNKNTPESNYYPILFSIFNILCKSKSRPTFDKGEIDNLDGPFLLVSNHGSFFDVYYLSKLADPNRMSFILNRYYFRTKWIRKILNKMGTIPKKLFSPDLETIKKTLHSVKNGYPVLMCPEGRLSVDGTNYAITSETGKLIKKLRIPVVIARINGAYMVNAKWRPHRVKGNIHTEVRKIISAEEINNMSVSEINKTINENIAYNDFEYARENNFKYKDKNKAKGLHNVLYRCPNCHKEYTIETKGNNVKCNHCGFSLDIQEDYWFNENELGIRNIHDWYKYMVNYENENTIKNNETLTCEVTVKKLHLTDKKLDIIGEGVCRMNNDSFDFKGIFNGESEEFSIPTIDIKGLAFTAGEEFEFYRNDRLYYFYPKQNPQQCTKWALIVDEIVKAGEENE